MIHHWMFNFDVFVGYAFGGFTAWAFIGNKWKTLTIVSFVVLVGLLVDIQRPLA